MGKIFIETTIHIDRWFGLPSGYRNKINNYLKGNDLITSKYIAGEYNRTIVRSLIRFYNLLDTSITLGIAINRIRKYQDRTPNTLLKVIGILADKFKKNDKKLYLDQCNVLIRLSKSRFNRNIFQFIDSIICVKGSEEPLKQNNNWIINANCRINDNPNCDTKNFMIENKDKFSILSNFFKENKNKVKKQSKVQEIIDEILINNYPKGIKCAIIGDVINTIECPDDAKLYTTDNDYLPLCNLLNKRIYLEKGE